MNGFLCTRGEERTAFPTWLAWQAGSVCEVLLMPKHRVDLRAAAFGKERSVRVPLKLDSIDAQALTKWLTDVFDVSRDAARVRLLKLEHLGAEHIHTAENIRAGAYRRGAGTITILSYSKTAEHINGNFDLTFGGDHVTGLFDALICEGLTPGFAK